MGQANFASRCNPVDATPGISAQRIQRSNHDNSRENSAELAATD